MGLEQGLEGETLRRLHQPQRIAVERLVDEASGIDGLDGIGHRQRRDRRAGFAGGRDGTRNQRRAGERPRRVVDQDDVGLAGLERLEAGAHRGLPGGAAEYRQKNINSGHRASIEIEVLLPNNRLYEADLAMFYEHGQRAPQHAFATDRPELLGQIAARARSPPSGDYDGCDAPHAVGAPWLPLGFSAFLLQREWISRFAQRLGMNNFLQCSTCARCQNG